MLRKTMFFLVLLRLAIGWHFLVEGWHKIHSTWSDQPDTTRPFSAEGYFRGATGPLGPVMRGQLPDPDDAALARLTLQPAAESKEAKPADRIPTVLSGEIDEYTKAFLASFNLDDKEKKQAETKAAEAKEKIYIFLTTSVPAGQHITDYKAKLLELRSLSDNKLPTLGRDKDNKRLTELKGEVVQSRKESLDALDAEMGKALRDELAGIIKKKLAVDQLAIAGSDEDPFMLPVPKDNALPPKQETRWNEHFDVFKAIYPLTEAQLQTAKVKLNTAKALASRWGRNKRSRRL